MFVSSRRDCVIFWSKHSFWQCKETITTAESNVWAEYLKTSWIMMNKLTQSVLNIQIFLVYQISGNCLKLEVGLDWLLHETHGLREKLSKTPVNILDLFVEPKIQLTSQELLHKVWRLNSIIGWNGHFYFYFKCKLQHIAEDKTVSKASTTIFKEKKLLKLSIFVE